MNTKRLSLIAVPLLLAAGVAARAGTLDKLCGTTPPEGIAASYYLWPSDDTDAWNGDYARYRKESMEYCRGSTPETASVIWVRPTWAFHHYKQAWLYPIVMVDAAGGILSTRGGEEDRGYGPYLNGKILDARIAEAKIRQAYQEKQGKPQIVILSLSFAGAPLNEGADLLPLHLIDMGVSPPFVSDVPMQIGNKNPDMPWSESVKIIKQGEGAYIISGWTYGKYNPENPLEEIEKPAYREYRYDRKAKMVTAVK